MKALVGAFNQENALIGAFSVIVKPMDRFTALVSGLVTTLPCSPPPHRVIVDWSSGKSRKLHLGLFWSNSVAFMDITLI